MDVACLAWRSKSVKENLCFTQIQECIPPNKTNQSVTGLRFTSLPRDGESLAPIQANPNSQAKAALINTK
jgi:hypothetical protein